MEKRKYKERNGCDLEGKRWTIRYGIPIVGTKRCNPKKERTGLTVKREALKILRQRQNEIDQAFVKLPGAGWVQRAGSQFQTAPGEIIAVRQCLDQYVAEQIKTKNHTRCSYKALGPDGFWNQKLGETPVALLTTELIKSTLDNGEEEYGWSDRTWNNRLSQISGALSWAMKAPRCWLSEHPIKDRIERRTIPKGQGSMQPLSLEQISAVCELAERRGHGWLPPIILVSFCTGLRLADVCGDPQRLSEKPGLRKRDFHPETDPPHLWIKRPKHRKPHPVFLQGEVLELVKQQADAAPEPDSFLFSRQDRRCAYNSAQKRFTELCSELGIQGSLHCLRHSFGKETGKGSVTPEQLVAAGAWSGPEMARHYQHLEDERRLEAQRLTLKVTAPIAAEIRNKLSGIVRIEGLKGTGAADLSQLPSASSTAQ